MNNQIKPLETIEVSIRYWWVLTGVMIIGGIFGFLFFSFTPSVFESRAIFSMFIDYTKTEKMTDIEADQAIVAAGDLFLSKKVVDGVLAEAGKKGIVLTPETFRSSAFLERTNSEWTIITRSGSPENSMTLVNIWAGQSAAVFREGSNHATRSYFYHRQLTSLTRCVEQVPSVEPAASVCGFASLTMLQEAIRSVSLQENQEADQSMVMIPGLRISLINQAEGPGNSIESGQSIDILAGAFLGLLIFVLLNDRLFERITTKRPA